MTKIYDEKYWKKKLTPEQYFITRESGTERPFSGKYNSHKEEGIYYCLCCEAELFDSKAKFDSFSGCPSFFNPISEDALNEYNDNSHNMNRVEIRCKKCEAHLGHVFRDGPIETGMRYCINSISLSFKNKKNS